MSWKLVLHQCSTLKADHYHRHVGEDLKEKGAEYSQICLNNDYSRMAFLNPRLCIARLEMLQSCPDKAAREMTPAAFTQS